MQKAKTLIIAIIFLAASLSFGWNSVNQLYKITVAQRETKNLEDKIAQIKVENIVLTERIKEATTAAVREGQLRDKLGLGTSNDYWLRLPPEVKLDTIVRQNSDDKTTENWKKWWELFTEKR